MNNKNEKLYFKVYKNKDSIIDEDFYIDTLLNCIDMCRSLKSQEIEEYTVFEPIFMHENKFKKLP